MGAPDRMETKRTVCDCGEGEFVFFTCELDGWSFINNPDVRWYEMHIVCDNCKELYSEYNPTSLLSGNIHRWKIKIEEPEMPPPPRTSS